MTLPTASDNIFPKLALREQGAPPASPGTAGDRHLWVDTNHVLYWKDSAGLASPLAALNKWDATAAPDADNDEDEGYSVGSRWIDVTNDAEYVCLDASDGAAVWVETTASSGAGLGAWQTWTPTWTGDGTPPALGNGTIAGRYRLLDASSMQLNLTFVRGSTSTNGTSSAYNFTLPAGYKAANARQLISARLLDSGTKHMAGVAMFDVNATSCFVFIADNTNGTANQIMGSAYPITLATGDELNINGVIEYATV